MASIRKQREQEFFASVGFNDASLSNDLVAPAFALLELGLRERHRGVYKTANDHYNSYGAGVVVLAVTALDAWMNEIIALLDIFGVRHKEVARLSVIERHRELLARLGAEAFRGAADLELAVAVRHEIVHRLPRRLADGASEPAHLRPLSERAILFTAPTEPQFMLAFRLTGYRLAYWTSATVEAAAIAVVEAVPPEHRRIIEGLAHAFSAYRRLPGPEALPEYDAQHGIELTRTT